MQNSVIRKVLRQALFESMSKKSIDKITVEEIIAPCGISRSTFYRNYRDKFDLMDDCYRATVDELNEMFNGDSRQKVIEGIYIFLKSRKGFFDNASKTEGTDSISRFLYDHTYTFYERQLKEKKRTDQLPVEDLDCIAFYCAGAVRMFELWIGRCMKETPQTMAEKIYHHMPTDLQKFF